MEGALTMNVLFTAKEIKELREQINKRKIYNNSDSKEIEHLNALYNAMYNIERKNAKRN